MRQKDIPPHTETIFMPTENVEQIGHGRLHIITSEEDTTRAEGRMIHVSSKLLWFKIANFDENKNIIENQNLMFEGEYAAQAARSLSHTLKRLIERAHLYREDIGSPNFAVIRLDNGNMLIKNGPASVEVNQEDIAALADKLSYVEALGAIG